MYTLFEEWTFAEITGDRPRQPAYEIKYAVARFMSISSDFLYIYIHTYIYIIYLSTHK